MSCCERERFELVEDLGHTEGVDWDLGTCASCGAHLLRQWSVHAPNRVFHDELTAAEAEAFRSSTGRDRVALLKQWYADH